MDKRLLQTYSVWAKDNLEKQVEISLKTLGINGDKDIKPARKVGDYTVIEGDPNSYPASLLSNRRQIIEMIKANGYKNVIEEFAYTWFNRIIALRFMEVHDFLSHGFRVLSNRNGGIEPEILKNLGLVKYDIGLDISNCSKLRDEGKIEELFRYVLLRQCNALAGILPMLFSKEGDHTELLLPKTLLKGETVITKLLEIPEENFLNDVEIIGWMYQFYISVKKDEVFASKKTITKDTLPAVTQLFTPDWIVRYMAENSVGRIWLESYPNSSLCNEMKYYIADPEQPEDVQCKIDAIKYRNVNPEDIRIIEPCCGSGHILVYVFDLLYKMYEEKGYQKRDIPTLILKKNLTGLDVDKRAAQLAAFSLVMKARSVNNQFFNEKYYVFPHVYDFYDSHTLELMGYQNMLKETGVLSDDDIKEFTQLVSTFKNGKTIGSLLKVKPMNYEHIEEMIAKIEDDVVQNIFISDFLASGLPIIKRLLTLAKVLSAKYDVMITNPPYVNLNNIDESVRQYALAHYSDSKPDMSTMFIEQGLHFSKGYLGIVTIASWIANPRFVNFRTNVIFNTSIISLLDLGSDAFEAGFNTTAFVCCNNNNMISRVGKYYDLTEIKDKNSFDLDQYHLASVQDHIEMGKICYKASLHERRIINKSPKLNNYGIARSGLQTNDNAKFIKEWFEVNYTDICFDNSPEVSFAKKWCPHIIGGGFRKWYGNNSSVLFWKDNGSEIINLATKLYGSYTRTVKSKEYYFYPCLAWSHSVYTQPFSIRKVPQGAIFNVEGPSIFALNNKENYILGLLNSIVARRLLNTMLNSIHVLAGDIANFPTIVDEKSLKSVDAIVLSNCGMSKEDWDSVETSWDFKKHPLMIMPWERKEQLAAGMHSVERRESVSKLSVIYSRWECECKRRFDTLKANEEELNRIFIEIYGLQDELTPEVEDKDVTVRLADKERDIKSLISYLIGIIMGRYSPDVEGLAYAGGEWDANKYVTYQPDNDGIVPIYTDLGMKDGLDTRIIELIKLVYGADTYRENIDFIAEVLGKKNSESSEEALNRYLNDGFYADHLKIYQKRPIYWMFSSGKNSGFKCLIYMHRYNSDTLARINGKYFLPESTRLKNELDELLATIEGSAGRDRIRLEKDRQRLADKYHEAIEYGQVLDHMANKYIDIDLDDGVKVNYAKFQGIELVTDNGTKVKKDLLVPIK